VSTEHDYPFDPAADVTRLRGLDKLRAVADRGTAAYLHGLWVKLEPTWRAEERRSAQEADYGVGGSAAFPDDYSAFDALATPERDTAARSAWDRKNALVFHAWQEWLEKLEAYKVDYLNRIGRELSRDQVAAHRERFVVLMRRQYGVAYADPKWLDEHNAWQERR
jgi:hypothetical protein